MRLNFTLLICTCLSLASYAQINDLKQFEAIPVNGINVSETTGNACDTLNGMAGSNWPAYFYSYSGGGTVFGVGNLRRLQRKIMENANFYDVSASSYQYVAGGLVYFALANTNTPANLDKPVVFKLYNDNNGLPGTAIDSVAHTLAQIREDVLAGRLTEFRFTVPAAISGGKFYISVNLNRFRWAPNVKDSIAIVATGDDDVPENTAFQYMNEGRGVRNWYPVDEFWQRGNAELDVSLFIFPLVSEDAAGCEKVLPVSLFNFGGVIRESKAYLNWSTAVESNNDGFYVERSSDGRTFSSVGFVKGAGNTNAITTYSFVDVIKTTTDATAYYRLKQVDVDGGFAYSKVLALNLQASDAAKWKLFPNPVQDMATVQLLLETGARVSAQVVSQDGKVLVSVDKGVLQPGLQQFYINTQRLAKGTYVLRIKADEQTYSGLMVKQ